MNCLKQEGLVEWLEELSKIKLSPSERVKVEEDIRKTIALFQKMDASHGDGEPLLSNVLPVPGALREDLVTNEDEKDTMMQNAPQVKNECYVVPATL